MGKLTVGNKGQSLVETAITLPLVLLLILSMISIGLFIYDKTVMVLAANKALDTAVGLLADREFNQDEIEKIEQSARDMVGTGIFMSICENEYGEQVFQYEGSTYNEGVIEIKIVRQYDCILPFVAEILGDNTRMEAQSRYVYKKR